MKLLDIFRSESQQKAAAQAAADKASADKASKAAEALKAAETAKAQTYNNAALEDLKELTEAMTATAAEHIAVYQEAIKHKQDYLNTLAKLKPLEEKSSTQRKELEKINAYILDPAQRINIHAVTSDMLNISHSEPTAYINRAQIRAAYAGREYAAFISSREV